MGILWGKWASKYSNKKDEINSKDPDYQPQIYIIKIKQPNVIIHQWIDLVLRTFLFYLMEEFSWDIDVKTSSLNYSSPYMNYHHLSLENCDFEQIMDFPPYVHRIPMIVDRKIYAMCFC